MLLEIVCCIIVVVVVGLMVYPNKHNTETFPHPDECWDCHRGSCEGCRVIKK